MMLDMTAIGVLISLLMNAINLLTNVRSILSAGEKKLEERLVKAETKLIEYDRRIQKLENDLDHRPTGAAIHSLELMMERMLGRLDAMDERLKPIAATNLRLQDYLLEHTEK